MFKVLLVNETDKGTEYSLARDENGNPIIYNPIRDTADMLDRISKQRKGTVYLTVCN